MQIFNGTTPLGTATTGAAGEWSFATTLAAGTYALHAVATDIAGDTASSAVQAPITIQTALPTVTLVTENQTIGTDNVVVRGAVTGPAGTIVEVYDGVADLGQATIDGTGNWVFTTPVLASGNHALSAKATDWAGNAASTITEPSITVGNTPSKLDLSKYTTVWQDDFTHDTQFNREIWTGVWGNPADFKFDGNGLTITSYQSQNWANAGFIQPDWGATQSQGYGLYSATAQAPAGQGAGICILLWPADGVSPGAELDLLEDWSDPTSQTGYMTVHWKGEGTTYNGNPHAFSLDLTKFHTYALDWEAGSLTFYVDGQQIIQMTGSEVPKDAAHGGVNEAFGAEVADINTAIHPEPTSQVALTISSMSYSALGAAPPSIKISDPGVAQEGRPGQGVDVMETITTTGVSCVYEAVFTKANVAEADWKQVTLGSDGVGVFLAHFENSTDYVVAISDLATHAVSGWSKPVTITEPVLPGVTITDETLAFDSGASATDGITNDGAVTLTGTVTGAHGTSVQVVDGATVLGAATIDGSGGWRFTTTLGPGSHALSASAADPAGNTAATPAASAITVLATAPSIVLTAAGPAVLTPGQHATLGGTVSGTGTTVEMFDGTSDLGAATLDRAGGWSFTAPGLADGSHTLYAVATDLAGNTAASSRAVLAVSDAVAASADINVGTGADKLVADLAGSVGAQFTVSVDGTQVGGVQTMAGPSQELDVSGSFAIGAHHLDITQVGGAAIYVQGGAINGFAITNAAGAASIVFGGSVGASPSWGAGPDLLTLDMSEDAYKGDATYLLSVDGTQLGGVQTMDPNALHGAKALQSISIHGTFATGAHVVSVTFLNDLYGGNSAADRNLYVDGAQLDGGALKPSWLAFGTDGTQSFAFGNATTSPVALGHGPDTLALFISEDAYRGDAQFTVSVDGTQFGGVQTVDSHALNKVNTFQEYDLSGAFGVGTHEISVSFLNDLYGGTRQTDRNLYVGHATLDGASIPGSGMGVYSDGSRAFSFNGHA